MKPETANNPKTIKEWLPKSTSPTPAQVDMLRALAAKHGITFSEALDVFTLQLKKEDQS